MLVTFEQTQMNTSLESFLDSIANRNLTFYASDLLQQKGCATMQELGQAVRRATEVCTSMHLPLRDNFKAVFRSRNGEVMQDWRLSPMAYLLTVINADAKNELVAKTQVEIVRRLLDQ